MATYLERYLGGEHEPVWAELTALGDRVREEPILADALAVARETMRRARENIDRLITRLDRIGYEFAASRVLEFTEPITLNPFTKQPLASPIPAVSKPIVSRPPGPNVASEVDEIEEIVGGLPLSLRAWFEIVGEVDLTGSHPDWPMDDTYPDPLLMTSAEYYLHHIKEKVKYARERSPKLNPWAVEVADFYGKAKVSGGYYWIDLPDLAADTLFHGEWHDQIHARTGPTPPENTFVNYLRTCFRWGGFPGFALTRKQPKQDLAFLATDLWKF